jgi:hypothetical protein
MRYLVTARVKPGREAALLQAIEDGTLGAGSVAGSEYLRNMTDARLRDEVPFAGSKFASAPHRWKRNGRTGKNTSSWSRCRTPTTATAASTRTAANPGPAATVIVP